MYSIVLLAAMTAGDSTPQFFFRHGCCGCSGCYGCGGGWGCHGCCGCWGCGGGYGCGGCCGYGGGYSCGGCCGYGCGGCSGYGCGGCSGYGCGGCHGSCYGGWGLPYSGYAPGWACEGGCGGYHSLAYGMHLPSVVVPPAGKVVEPEKKEEVKDGSAKVIIKLPSDAKLYVDDKPIPSADAQNTFRTPKLEKGQDYYYEVRAEVMRDGKPVSETKRVVVKAGAVIKTDFSTLGESRGVASAKKR